MIKELFTGIVFVKLNSFHIVFNTPIYTGNTIIFIESCTSHLFVKELLFVHVQLLGYNMQALGPWNCHLEFEAYDC